MKLTTEQKEKIKDLAATVRSTMRELDSSFNSLAAEFGLYEDNQIATHFASDWLHDAVYNCNNETIAYAIDSFEKSLSQSKEVQNGNV